MRQALVLLLFLISLGSFAQNFNGELDHPGDIAFLGYSVETAPTDADGFSFILLDSMQVNDSISFSDLNWTGTAFPAGSNIITWQNSTSNVLAPGTVVNITDADNDNSGTDADTNGVSIGTILNNNGITTEFGDQIFAFTGSLATPGTFLSFVGTLTASPTTLAGTGLDSGTTASIRETEGVYTGSLNCTGNIIDCIAMINDTNNWTSGNFTFPSGVPTSSSGPAFTPSAVSAEIIDTVNNTVIGGSVGRLVARAIPGVGNYTYSWSNGSTTSDTSANTDTISGLEANIYTVTITDANGTTAIASAPVAQPFTATITDSLDCGGTNVGRLIASASGTAPYTYSWSNGSSTTGTHAIHDTIDGLAGGTYTVTITDDDGTSGTFSATIDAPASAFTASLFVTPISCFGGTGQIFAFPTPGPTYTYTWDTDPPQTSQLASSLIAGTYTVIIDNGTDCIVESNTLTQPDSLIASTGSVIDVLCNGDATGGITASAVDGTSPYTYLWTDGETSAIISSKLAGTYTVTVTDANGCTDTSSSVISEPAAIVVNSSIVSSPSCAGFSNGGISTAPTGGTSPYTYVWTDGETTSSIGSKPSGTYTVTVTDNNGCTETESQVVTAPAPLVAASSTTQTVSCNGGSDGQATSSATGGTTPYTYDWSSGESTNAITAKTAATYTVTITDANGCSDISSTSISEPSILGTLVSSQTNVDCNGNSTGSATVTGTGGTTPYTYNWSSGETIGTISGKVAGDYTVTVNDANSCGPTTRVVTITEPAVLTATMTSQTNVDCNGNSTGSLTVTGGGGTTPYTYAWNGGGSTSDTKGSLAAGTHTVTITDAQGCTETASATITEPAILTATMTSQTNVDCNGNSTGSLTVTGGGGTTPYTYAWNGGGSTSDTKGSLAAGTHTVTITDAQGCTETASATITEPAVLTATMTSQTNVDCNGNSTGSLTVTGGGGTTPYTYAWNGGGSTSDTKGSLAAGTHTVTITDAQGCTETASATITEPALLAVSIGSQTNVDCNGNSTGSATAAPTGGTPPYTYSWNGGGTSITKGSLAAGTHTVSVNDANNCGPVSTTVTITEPAILTATMTSQTNVDCNGNSTGSLTVTGGGGTTPYTYAWNGGGSTSDTKGSLAAGTHTVTITDAQGCTETASATITEPAILTATMTSQTNVDCNGNSTGSLTVTGGGGTTPYTYAWNGGGSTSDTKGSLAAGTHTVTITDAQGCTETASATITEPAVLTATMTSQTNVDCNGNSTGSLTVTGGGGTTPYTYAWNGGGSTSDTKGSLAAGTHTVTITDAQGCTETASATITEPAVLAVSIGSQTNVDCNGNSTGSLTVTGGGGTTPYTYAWNGGGSTSDTKGSLAAGTHTVTITDAQGCTETASATITEPAVLAVSIGSQTNVDCNGNSTGSATAAPTGGTPPYTYSWNGGGTSITKGSLAAGTHTVSVNDANNCGPVSTTVTITEPAILTATMTSQTNVDCNGNSTGSLTVTGGGGTTPYTYAWNGGGSTSDTKGSLAAGTHTVTITDAQGCTETASATITEPAVLTATMTSQTNVDCNGNSTGSLTVTGGGGTTPYTYAWNGGGSTSDTKGSLAAGTHTVTITDAQGCTETASATITEPALLAVSIGSQTNVDCNGNSTGSATAAPTGGTPPYTYSWNGGGTSITKGSLAAGTHTVSVNDANNCGPVSTTVTITEPAILTATMTSQTNVDCNGNSTGSLTVTGGGGTTPYTYAWNGGGSTSDTKGSLAAGTHTVTITDAQGCTETASATITEPAVLTATMTSQTNVDCNGNSTGSLTVTGGGGTTPYTYAWNGGGSTSDTKGSLAAGTHTVTITDAQGCTETASATITEPAVLTATMTSQTNVDCNGNSTGSLTVTGGGGTTPYTYAWNGGGSTSDTKGSLAAGTHTVTITDAQGCTETASATITEPALLAVSIGSQTNVDCNGNSTGSATAAPTGGTPPYTYSWNGGGTSITKGSLAAGTHTVSVNDANNCGPVSTTVTITEPAILTATMTSQTNVDCNGNSTGSLTVTGGGGTTPYTYAWNGGGSTSDTKGSLAAGTHTVTITDAQGCTETASATITEPAILTATMTSQTNVDCNGNSTGSLTVTGGGGTTPYTYAWNGGGSTSDTKGSLAAGTHTVTITDAQGCTETASATITEPALLAVSIGSQTNVDCNGNSTGSATAAPTGGTPPYTYSWNGGGTSITKGSLAAGTHTVSVNDANNCGPVSTTVTITEPAILTAMMTSQTNVDCNGNSTGSLTVTGGGGTTPYTYAWNGGGSTSDTKGSLAAGTHTVTITDAQGCTETASATITEPAILTATMTSQTNVDCNGNSTGSLTVTGGGGTTPYTYAWNGGGSTSDTKGSLAAGTHTITITDAQGCTETASATITEPTVLVTTLTVDSNASCNGALDGGITANTVGGTPPYTYSWSNSPTTATNPGITNGTYTITVTDNNGCINVESETVLDLDVTPPVIVKKDTTLYLDVNGLASITANDIDNGSSDVCGISSRVIDSSNFDCSEIGINKVELRVTDLSGNVSFDTAIVTVLDTIRPTVVANDTTLYLDENGLASVTALGIDDGSSDNCGIMTYALDSTDFDCSEIGANTVTLYITDDNNNIDSITATVTVLDTVRPAVVTKDTTLYLDVNGLASITANDIDNGSSDACGIQSISIDSTNFDCSEVGANTVTLYITDDNNNIDSATATVTVLDTIRPTVVANDTTLYLDENGLASVTALGIDDGSSDNCGIMTYALDSTNFDCSEIGANTVTLYITDDNNNIDSITATVTVLDTIRPTVVANDTTLYLDENGLASVTAIGIDDGSSDNCGIMTYALDSTDFDCSEIGANTVTLYITDDNNNIDSITATVTVLDTVRPAVVTKDTTLYLDVNGLASITANDIDNGSSDACGIQSISIDSTNFDCSEVGANTVTLYITDDNNNIDSATATVTVLDTIRPTVVANDTTLYLDENGLASVTALGIDDGSSDNCGIMTYALDSTNFDCSEIGANTVTLYITDDNNNIDSITATVTVLDTVRPAVVTKDTTLYLDVNGLASITANDIDNGSSDACGIQSISIDSTNFDCSEVGANTVTLYITDDNNNIDSATAIVTVLDTVRPAVVTKDTTLYLDVNGLASITANDIDNGSNDACGIQMISIDSTNFDCSEVGANTVTLYITDDNNNIDSATATVTVLDTIRPTVVANDTTLYLDENGLASVTAIGIDDGSSDNCGIMTYALDSTDFDCSEIGANTVTLYITDDNNNIDSITATVTVLDTVRPAVVTKDTTLYLDVNGLASITANDIDNGSSDACGIQSISIDSTNFDCSEVGANTVTLYITDDNNNIDSATATVTVLDTIRPTVVANDTTLYLDENGLASVTALGIDDGSIDNCGIMTYALDSTNFDCSEIGANTVTLYITDDNNNIDSITATVTVLDTIRPTVVANDTTLYLDENGLASVTAIGIDDGSSDNCGIMTYALDSTDFDCSEIGANTVTLYITDDNNNIDSITATVTVLDTVRPAVVTKDTTLYLDVNGLASITANDIDNGSSDACGIQSISIDSTNFDCSEVGANTVTLYITDDNNNIDSATATVTVLDTIRPTVVANDTTLYLDENGLASVTALGIDDGSSDNCGIMTYALDSTNFDCSEIGANTVTLYITDDNNNIDSITATVTVLDTVRPAVVTKDTTLYLDVNGLASITANDIDNGSSDACGIQSISIDSTNFDCSEVGANTVTLYITDDNNNIDSATAIVTVLDTVRPAVVTKDTTLYLDVNGLASITANDIDNGSNDACGIQMISIDSTNFDCSEVGANTVTLYITDDNNNIDSATATVTVLDTIRPTVVANDTTLYLDENGLASVTAIGIDDGSSDNCGIMTYALDSTDFDCSEIGANTVTLYITDDNNNIDSITATVTVLDTVRPAVVTKDTTLYLDVNGLASITANDIDNGSSDACGIQSISIDSTNFDCSEVGANTVTLYITDDNNNIDSATATVTVLDTIRPTVVANDTTLYLDENGLASVTALGIDDGSIDNCGIMTYALDSTNFDCSEIGANTVTLYITDDNNNIDSITATVTVLDTIRPTVVANDTTLYLDENGLASVTAIGIDDGSSDNCGIMTYALDSTDFDCSEIGANTVTLYITDDNNNIDSITATVTVLDTVRPAVVTKDTTLYLDVNGLASITANDIDNGSSDACGIQSISIDSTNFDCSEVGANTVTLYITDDNNNIDSATATVTVLDTIRPTVVANDTTLYLDENGLASVTALGIDDGSSDNCGIMTYALDSTNFDCSEIGANTVTLYITDDNNNIDSITATVTVLDTIRPTVVANDTTLYLDENGLASVTAIGIDDGSSDNCGIMTYALDSTDFDCSEIGANTVTLYITDDNNNIDSITATVTVLDTVRPAVVTKDTTLYLDVNGLASITANDIDNGSSDACGIQSISIDSTNFDCSEVGANTVTLYITDDNNNIDSATATVTVLDTIRPTVVANDTTLYLDENGLASVTALGIDDGSSDNCGIMTYALDSTNFDCSEIGANTVTLYITDDNNNIDSITTTVTVLDTVRPAVVTKDTTLYLDVNGLASITANDIDNGSSDACGIQSISIDSTNFDCSEVGANTVTLYITDDNNNIDSAIATVTVLDTSKPIINSCPTDIIVNSELANCLAIVSWTLPSAIDNCNIDSLVSSHSSGDAFPVGNTTVTYIAYDPSMNTDTCSFIITVIDDEDPVLSNVPADIVVANDFRDCGAVVSWVPPTANDNCSIDSTNSNYVPNDTFPVGITTVEYITYDSDQNTDTVSFTITVNDNETPRIVCINDTTICDEVFTFSLPTGEDNCGVQSIVQTEGIPSGGIYPLGITINKFIITDIHGNTDSCSFSVNRDEIPTVSVAGLDTNICVDNYNLAANTPIIGNGLWSSPNIGVTFVNSSNPTTQVNGLNRGANTLIWTISNGVCNPSIDTVIITYDEAPTTSLAGNNQTLCSIFSTTLQANIPVVGSGSWSLGSGSGNIINPTDPNTSVENLGIGVNELIWSIDNGTCPASNDTVLITASNIPVANAGLDQEVLEEDGVRLEANTVNESGFSYSWSPSSLLDDPLNRITQSNDLLGETTVFVVTVSNQYGCSNVDSVLVTVKSGLTISSAITPNNDGINDTWVIKNLNDETIVSHKVVIYDGYGKELYSSSNFVEWNGEFNGSPLPIGSYYYVVEVKRTNGETKVETGIISILR